MKTASLCVAIIIIANACQNEFYQLHPSTDSTSIIGAKPICQAAPIEKNIVGTWHFESNRTPNHTIRTGSVTFDAQNHISDPDSLFENQIDTGSKRLKVVDKTYTTDGAYFGGYQGYTGKIFRVDLVTKNNEVRTIWPLYVASNECNKIVIYQLSSYNQPVAEKFGFTLTR